MVRFVFYLMCVALVMNILSTLWVYERFEIDLPVIVMFILCIVFAYLTKRGDDRNRFY
jgi:hypothetical protein